MSDPAGAANTIRRALETAVLLSVGPFPGEYQLGPDKAALAALDVLLAERIISDALAAAGEPSQDRETPDE